MKTKKYNLYFLLAIILFSNFSVGNQESNTPGNDNSSQNGTGPGATTNVAPANTGVNIQQSAVKADKGNKKMETVAKVVGTGMIAYGAWEASHENYGTAALYFGMGALSFMQAKKNKKSADGANITIDDTSSKDNPFGDPDKKDDPNVVDDNNRSDPNLSTHVNTGKLDEIVSRLTTSGIGGIKMDKKTGNIFDSNSGKTYTPDQFKNAASMSAAGFSDSDINSALKAASKSEKDILKKLGEEGIGAATAENGFQDGSGKLGTLSSGSSGLGGLGGLSQRSTASLAPTKAPSNQIAGLSKNFNGDRIGVGADNIFMMMTRRYKTKEKQNSFFENNELMKAPR